MRSSTDNFAGLAFATVLTLIAAPVFYHILFKPEPQAEADNATDDAGTAAVTA